MLWQLQKKELLTHHGDNPTSPTHNSHHTTIDIPQATADQVKPNQHQC